MNVKRCSDGGRVCVNLKKMVVVNMFEKFEKTGENLLFDFMSQYLFLMVRNAI